MLFYFNMPPLGVPLDFKSLTELAVKILCESVRFKTVLGEAYENIVDYYREILKDYGIHVTTHRVPDEYVKRNLPLQFNPDKPRYILLARVGYGEKVLQFNGHYDVVPPGEGWTRPPFEPSIDSGKLYGRGVSDMKGGIAAILATLIHFAQTREPEIVLEAALVPDEEIGGVTGTGYLVRELGSKPNWVVIAEPSGIDGVYTGHRGNIWFLVKIHGKQAHGSSPWLGDNAFEKMLVYAKLFIEEYRRILESKTSNYEYEDPRARNPTITPGGVLISPGAVNVVPGICGFSVDRRLVVEENVENAIMEVERLLEELNKRTGIRAEVEVLDASNPAYTRKDAEVVQALAEAINKVVGKEPRLVVCAGGLDLKYYAEKGIPAIAYGPGMPGTAHRPDEYVLIEHLERVIEVYIELVKILEKG